MKIIYIEDDNEFYSNIKKYKKNEVKVYLKYENKVIKNDKDIKRNMPEELIMKIHIITALNIENIEERYNYIYDVTCNYLDEKFNKDNLCDFKNNKCISVRNNSHCKESENGCCYGRKRGLCKNFKDGRCMIKSLSCKLFTCRYLKKNNIRFKVNDIPLLKYFFNAKQKYIIDTSIFKDKDEMIRLLLNNM